LFRQHRTGAAVGLIVLVGNRASASPGDLRRNYMAASDYVPFFFKTSGGRWVHVLGQYQQPRRHPGRLGTAAVLPLREVFTRSTSDGDQRSV